MWNARGEIFRPEYVTNHFSKFLEQNHLRQICFHDLRHSCASLLATYGVPMKQIQLWLGYSTFSTTADIYAHLSTSALNESAECIAVLMPPKEKEAVIG